MKDLKIKLDSEAYEKLRDLIKIQTNINNLTEENIKVKKEAINLLISWLSEIYLIDKQELTEDLGEMDINNLFKAI